MTALFSRPLLLRLALLACAALACGALQARVTRIVIDDRVAVPDPGNGAVAYEQVFGRAFGELDPTLPGNAIVQDIGLAKDADGKVRFVASFQIVKPVDMAKASGLMWHDVPNRGNFFPVAPQELAFGDVVLGSAWQGDNSGNTAVKPSMKADGKHWLQLPVAKRPDGSAITGSVLGRIVNRQGPDSQPLIVQTNPVPYVPMSLDTARSRLVSRDFEAMDGQVRGEQEIKPGDWAWGACSAANPFPGTPDASQICLKAGFDAKKLYQVVYTAKDPYVLGIGFAAWRDVGQFFKTAAKDDAGTANPLAANGKAVVTHSIGRGVSQSGNFLRGWLHLGFNQGENGLAVHDGLWPIIAGRRIALNFRWAQPDGVLELYQAGSEGPQWWLRHPDPVRGGPPGGILDRCTASGTCPKIIEHFGSAEVWALKLTPEWVGTDGVADLPLPPNVRRYYIASSNHGGGAGGFDTSIPGAALSTAGAQCPGNNFGIGVLPPNPMPHTQTVNALRVHFRNWVQRGVLPPESAWPRLNPGAGQASQLADANQAALGMPTLPGLRPTLPEPGFIMPVLDYDFGPLFNAQDTSGVPSNAPPTIRRALRMLAPKVNADGNELGGVPVVLADAPLGTYLGWNVTADGDRPFHAGQICNYVGGMLPFARTESERQQRGDPRPSLEARYKDHDGYVAAVRMAADNAMKRGFLLAEDAAGLVKLAQDSKVLR